MFSSKSSSRLSVVRGAGAAVIFGLVLTFAANVSAASGYAFIDSIVEFFGVEQTQTSAQTEQSTETASASVVEPMEILATCTSTATGNWNAVGTWSCGQVPTSADDVTILAGHTVT
ncbi:MAG: hypothetical protein ACKVRN_02820, partial [Pyrinomonadaceae bacterium]